MDWNNFKAPSWDMMSNVVDEEATLPNIEPTLDDDEESSTRFGVYYRTKLGDNNDEFSVDLKLGQVGNYHPGSDHIVPNNKSKIVNASNSSALGVSKIASTPSSSYKRSRAINNGTFIVSCLVDGCNSDLSTCRDYHRRHKVCEQHSKTPEVTIGGFKQRFCQQCSRFHSLEQFDEGKRSCRKRLDGHNRRRRKPQPEPVTRPTSYLSNYQGRYDEMVSFSRPHAYSPSAMMMSPAWACSDADNSSRLHNHNHNHIQHQQQELLLGSSTSPPISYNNASFFQNNIMLCDSSSLVPTSSSVPPPPPPPPRALSLLSSSSSSSSLTHHRMSLMQPLGLSLLPDDDNGNNNNNNFESMEKVLFVPNISCNNNNNCNGSDCEQHCCSSSSVYYDNHNIGGGSGGGAAASDGSHQGNETHHQLFPFQ